mmetsp:Transcript_48911/g.156612  ORF Transcript_48911/g.156612 Transcript_48911/m.156612 type:complete len:231 (-) Transcript_48911:165-857(-)
MTWGPPRTRTPARRTMTTRIRSARVGARMGSGPSGCARRGPGVLPHPRVPRAAAATSRWRRRGPRRTAAPRPRAGWGRAGPGGVSLWSATAPAASRARGGSSGGAAWCSRGAPAGVATPPTRAATGATPSGRATSPSSRGSTRLRHPAAPLPPCSLRAWRGRGRLRRTRPTGTTRAARAARCGSARGCRSGGESPSPGATPAGRPCPTTRSTGGRGLPGKPRATPPEPSG